MREKAKPYCSWGAAPSPPRPHPPPPPSICKRNTSAMGLARIHMALTECSIFLKFFNASVHDLRRRGRVGRGLRPPSIRQRNASAMGAGFIWRLKTEREGSVSMQNSWKKTKQLPRNPKRRKPNPRGLGSVLMMEISEKAPKKAQKDGSPTPTFDPKQGDWVQQLSTKSWGVEPPRVKQQPGP